MEYNHKLTKNAQSLRKSMTKEEARLWYQYLCRTENRFRRKVVIGNYIVDFYCHAARLAVELDGSQHCTPEEAEYDENRTAYLESIGIKVVRFSNLDVLRRFRDVCGTVHELVEARTKQNP